MYFLRKKKKKTNYMKYILGRLKLLVKNKTVERVKKQTLELSGYNT